jgi:carbon-monoxide dehydrogenase medium subunit
MKPPPFDYAAPTDVAEVLELLRESPEDAALLAGGQSLMPVLNMRMAQPRLVVDLNRVAGLDSIEETAGGRVRFGSMVRQRRVELDGLTGERLPLLTRAVRHVAHAPIRVRGTIGGSLAHADPAAELPATIAALDGTLTLQGPAGERTVAAGDFFAGPLTTVIDPGELLVGVEVQPPPPGSGSAFLEVARTHGAFALVAVAATVHLDGGGIDHVRLALAGVGGRPYVPSWLDEAAVGEAPGAALFDEIGARVSAEVDPFDDIHATAGYRSKVAGVLTARALGAAASDAGGERAA